MMTQEEQRFRSFAERYVIERASSYRSGNEEHDAWRSVQEAVSIYKMIETTAANKFSYGNVSVQPVVGRAKREGN